MAILSASRLFSRFRAASIAKRCWFRASMSWRTRVRQGGERIRHCVGPSRSGVGVCVAAGLTSAARIASSDARFSASTRAFRSASSAARMAAWFSSPTRRASVSRARRSACRRPRGSQAIERRGEEAAVTATAVQLGGKRCSPVRTAASASSRLNASTSSIRAARTGPKFVRCARCFARSFLRAWQSRASG